MREIKFRAWDNNAKKMFYDIRLLFANSLNDCFEEYKECGLQIMQYTGLKDKDDKEIYEGDIAKVMDATLAVVKYSESRGAYYLDHEDKIGDIGLICQYETIGVVGNIYENPELLEETP